MLNEQNIISQITEEKTCSDQKIHVAVSGGADSMCLLYLASQISDVNIMIHHVKHNVSDNTEKWASFVRETSQTLGFNIEDQYVEHNLSFDSMTNFESEARKSVMRRFSHAWLKVTSFFSATMPMTKLRTF